MNKVKTDRKGYVAGVVCEYHGRPIQRSRSTASVYYCPGCTAFYGAAQLFLALNGGAITAGLRVAP